MICIGPFFNVILMKRTIYGMDPILVCYLTFQTVSSCQIHQTESSYLPLVQNLQTL